jgi:hypothetical protein
MANATAAAPPKSIKKPLATNKAVLNAGNVIDKDKKNNKKRPNKTDEANDTCGCRIF